MTALDPPFRGTAGRFDPAFGRVPSAVAHALFRGDDWLSTADLSITTVLEAAAPNTGSSGPATGRSSDLAAGSGRGLVSGRADRIRLPTRPELLVRFVTDLLGGYGGEPARARSTVLRYLSTLHLLLDAPDPTKAPMVRHGQGEDAR